MAELISWIKIPIWYQIYVSQSNVSRLPHCAIWVQCLSLSQWPGGQASARGVLTQLWTMWLLAYPNWDLSLSATDLGHRSVSDEVIRLLCCSCWWQDWIEIQRRYKKGEVLLVCTGTQSVHMVKCVIANCRAQSKWNRRSSIMSKPLVISLRFCLQDEIHQSKVYGTVKN